MDLREDVVDALRARAQREIDQGHIPSCQLALALEGEVVVSETLGDAAADARYLMMSATKPVFASVVLQLIGEGRLDPALPVSTWWPGFGANGKEGITLEQVMTHTCGLPNRSVTFGADRDQRVAEMEAWTLEWEPGSAYRYHGLSVHWILAELVARITGDDHRDILRTRILDPLGLDRLELGVPIERQHDVQRLVLAGELPTGDEIRGALKAWLGFDLPEGIELPIGGAAAPPSDSQQPPELFLHLESPEGLVEGIPGAGGVADAASVARFYQALLHNTSGLWDQAALGDAQTNARTMLPDDLGRPAARSLIFELAGTGPEAIAQVVASGELSGTFGQSGAMGQLAWANRRSGLSFAFLTNGADLNFVRQYNRDFDLNRLAAACVAS